MLKYIPHFPISRFIVMFVVASALALSTVRAPAQDAEVPTPDAATHLHHIKTVFIIVMENHNWTGDGRRSIKGNPAASYINYTLLPEASHAENYSNPPGNHPSLPNYLWLESGTNFGIKNDNTPAHNHRGTREHLVTLLQHAGISWKSYDENISGKVCPLTDEGPRDANGNPLYGVRHDPFVYFDDVTGSRNAKSSYCIAHIRPFTELQRDLASNDVARYNFITPNVCDDMHDACGGDPIAHGDAWLRRNVPHILNSTAFRSGGALFITWDEAANKNGPIPMLVLSPFAKGNHYSNHLYYTHGSMLRTLEEIFGVSPLMRDAAHERDLRDMFRVFP
ncbi:MAG: phosphatidylinositol-3-phosphatase [Acidobacteriaceae bacterium]|nr:phosphatidylinositol-3-phosphatase [Acidobacteriaceae bacterium]